MGAGYHGGFGATNGSAYKKAFSISSTNSSNNISISKKDIIGALTGVTEMSTQIAKYIAQKKIGVNILGDSLFESMIDKDDGKRPNDVVGFQRGNQIYVRRSAVNGFGIFVHEGTHAYEYRNQISEKEISSYKGELRAYINEHDYQVKKGEHVEFKNHDEIRVHIKLYYK